MDNIVDRLSFELESISSQISNLTALKHEKEREIINAIGRKEEGTLTKKTSFYKTSIVGKVSRSFDKGVDFDDVSNLVGRDVAKRIVRRKLEINTSEYKALPDDVRSQLSKVITTKPAKSAIKIERIEEDANE